MFVLKITILLIIVILIIIISIHLFTIENEYFNSPPSTNESQPIILSDIFVYIIHKKEMTQRYERIMKQLTENFPNNQYEIVEPISIDYIQSKLKHLLDNKILLKRTYECIMTKKKVYKGTHTLKTLSLTLTNFEIYKKELTKNRYFIILEDDFKCIPNFKNTIQIILYHLPNHWDLIYLSCHLNKKRFNKNNIKNYLLPIHVRTHGQGGVLYNPQVLSRLLKYLHPIDLQIDHDIPDKLILKKI